MQCSAASNGRMSIFTQLDSINRLQEDSTGDRLYVKNAGFMAKPFATRLTDTRSAN